MAMISSIFLFTAVICTLVLFSFSSAGAEVGPRRKVVLNDCVIIVYGDQPSYVIHAVNEMRDYLRDITGQEVPVNRSENTANGTVISVGTEIAPKSRGRELTTDNLGAEGYQLRSVKDGQRIRIIVTGATAKGTMNGLNALMRMIRADGKSAYLEADVNVTSKPSFAVRGFHFNGWMFNSPYSFRTWTESEWHSYIDTLGYQHVNLLYLWPFMEIIPLPLSKEDTEYLEEVRRVVDYAQTAHGMEVWIMQAANRVATNNVGVDDPRFRPYWRHDIQRDLNPGNPEEFKTIMASHEALYKIVNNVDGVCTIDTDPGSYKGSTLEEYMAIFKGCRELLDKHNAHGRQAKLVHWMWFGWGLEHNFEPEWQGKTIESLKASLPEPWWLVSGVEKFLPVNKKSNTLGKTIFLRYATIETEPSYPGTNVGLGEIPKMFGFAEAYPGLLGVMGNAQCPLLQCGRIYHQLMCSWDLHRVNLPTKQVLLETAELLYPEQKEMIADCYDGLGWTDPAQLAGLVNKLDRVVAANKLGRAGLISRKLFPDYTIVARSLLMQLRLRAALQRMYAELQPDSNRSECLQLMEDCLDAYLAWDKALGWHQLWGAEDPRWQLGRFGGEEEFRESLRRLRIVLGSETVTNAFLDEMAERLGRKHGRAYVVANATDPVKQALLR